LNELQIKANQTPIEIALQIDESGMTTARKLYEFLEMAKSQFSRWAKTNIEEDIFYEQGTDWIGFDIMSSGNETKDYKITTEFAKHLCMLSKSDKGKIARNYFLKAEDKLKEIASANSNLSPELQMFQQQSKMFQLLFDAQVKNELMLKRTEEKADKAIETSQAIKETIIGIYDDWRSEIKHLVASIQRGMNKAYQDTYNELYDALEKRAHCDLSKRVNNGRFRLAEQGTAPSKIKEYRRIDVIEADPKLKEIFTTIVKEYAVKYVA
jgi:anti-repressor protein